MAVALFILAVGIAGAASMLVAAATTTAATEHRSAMERLAISELQAAVALDDEVLGISLAAGGYRPAHDGRATATTPDAAVRPLEQTTVAGLEVTIRRDVTWGAASAGAVRIDEAYKVVTITVSWTDASGPHTIVASSAALDSVAGDPSAEAAG